MSFSKSKKPFKKALLFGISLALAAVYLLLAVVVIMFLSSTIHMLNPGLFKFKDINIVNGVISAVVLVVSIAVFIRVFVRTYGYLRRIVLKDVPE